MIKILNKCSIERINERIKPAHNPRHEIMNLTYIAENKRYFAENKQYFAENKQYFAENKQYFAENKQYFAEKINSIQHFMDLS